jgi:hypothetical protein
MEIHFRYITNKQYQRSTDWILHNFRKMKKTLQIKQEITIHKMVIENTSTHISLACVNVRKHLATRTQICQECANLFVSKHFATTGSSAHIIKWGSKHPLYFIS